METISPALLNNPMDYATYRQLIDELVAQDKTTGEDHSENMLQYTRLNVSRMNRLDKTTRLAPATEQILAGMDRPLTWLVLTEAWCGDAAQTVPVLAKLAEAAPQVNLELILRDGNLPIMDAFLTNGGRSIPKVVLVDTVTREVLGTWGPRPQAAQQIMMDAKAASLKAGTPVEGKSIMEEGKKDLQKWYARDKTQSIQLEFLASVRAMTGMGVPA